MIADVNEQYLYDTYPGLLDILLFDRTTRRNILWATDDYMLVSPSHQAEKEITVEAITDNFAGIIAPRTAKTREQQAVRTKGKAEVFTPSWLCNEQNNLLDEAWFGRSGVFNTPTYQGWRTNHAKIIFLSRKAQKWQNYVDEKRLEITCGEAPYLVSRYDVTTGRPIELKRRIGLLDRKMRVVTENATNETEWLKWSERAFQSVYGFEYQGDSLLLARENLLASYNDYACAALRRSPTHAELVRIAAIISWNLWQMDGLTGTIPFKNPPRNAPQTLFPPENDVNAGPLCRIRDWRSKKTVTFLSLSKGK
ncbi:hypothetical protein ACUIAC_05570 [Dermabacteraceae bacterium P13138]